MADEETEFNLSEDPAFKKLVETMGTLGTMVKQNQQVTGNLTDQISKLTESLSTSSTKDEPDETSTEDIDSMTNSELLNRVLSSVEKVVDKKVGGITESLDKFKSDTDTKDARSAVEDFAKEHKDVYEWTEEIKKIFEETPGISISNAYKLARMDNVDKTAEMDEKYSDEPKKEEKKVFGGLTPTSRVSDEDETSTDDKPMDVDEAAKKAWDEAVAEFPALVGE